MIHHQSGNQWKLNAHASAAHPWLICAPDASTLTKHSMYCSVDLIEARHVFGYLVHA